MVKRKKAMAAPKEVLTKEDLKKFKEKIIHEFHIISEGLIDQIKLLAEGHSGIIDRLGRMEKENERQHQETRALVSTESEAGRDYETIPRITGA
jgi:acetyl-CoA carboxylase carboxyltransferase component